MVIGAIKLYTYNFQIRNINNYRSIEMIVNNDLCVIYEHELKNNFNGGTVSLDTQRGSLGCFRILHYESAPKHQLKTYLFSI